MRMAELPPLIPELDSEPPPKDFESYVHHRFHQVANNMQAVTLHMAVQTQILEGQAKVTENQARLIERLSIDLAGDGNGRPGVKAELKDIKRWQSEHDRAAEIRSAELKEKAEAQRRLVMWGLGVLGTIISMLVTSTIASYRQSRATQENQQILSRQIQQIPGAHSAPMVSQ